MQQRTCVPYCTSGEPPGGCSSVRITVYGASPKEVEERFIASRSELHQIGTHITEYAGNRWRIAWQENVVRPEGVFQFNGKRRR